MDENKILEEKLRECASIGDKDGVEECLYQGSNINSQNKMNGWTALHWASKRGHPTITKLLLGRGADPKVETSKGELAIQLTKNEEIKQILGKVSGDVPPDSEVKSEPLPITPNYIQYPPFPHGRSSVKTKSKPRTNGHDIQTHHTAPYEQEDELVLKVRVAESAEKDFIEVELPRDALTFENLLGVCCEELQVASSEVVKVRKRPNTIVRKDKDVRRLQDFQELELVTKKKPPFGTTAYSVPMQNLLY